MTAKTKEMELNAALKEIYEIWAGSEGIPLPKTAPEAYLLGLVEQMRDIARDALASASTKPKYLSWQHAKWCASFGVPDDPNAKRPDCDCFMQRMEKIPCTTCVLPSSGRMRLETTMTDLRTAAQQALEALEGGADSWERVGPAIDALKEALVEDAMQKFTDVNQELEAALAEPVQEPGDFDHGIGADRFKVVRGAFWWHVLIGDSPTEHGKFRSRASAEKMAADLLREFRNGAFVQHEAALAKPVQEQPVCDECGKSKCDGWALYCVGCVEPLFTSKTEPVDPVAWMNTEDGFCTLDSPVEGIDVMSQWVPLYGSPPQRQAEPVQEPVQDGKCKHCVDGCPACDARKLPVQEPVAWMHVPHPGNGMSPMLSLSKHREPSMYAASVPLYFKEQL